ncbi:glycosyltransferase [Sphingomonas abaci]|uniref:Chitooligosaccharide deacetylase n=1 Tax=Sphingomonas abaci TaxID=237611 RepID=A0A7W7AK79_9SPHN|nr:glycosyltransferase [Sphingomonas abaci]MBB4617774.1 cellulose synthase/poly-beta-1,6-N-acetylglucosamine synthase-like glycosyltransferase/peptidoglycan/xylan/chitin deacetylase (PgdA/CDA1 family)/spore germination protein YaaH [Sphingomonas abaci]
MSKPIFYDPSGNRRAWSLRGVLLLVAVILLAAIAFAVTILNVPAGASLRLPFERPRSAPLAQRIAAFRHGVSHELRQIGWLPKRTAAGTGGRPLTVGFYVPWADASRVSLERHVGQLDWVVPAQFSVTGPRHTIVRTPDPRFDAILAASPKRPAVLPMVQNTADGDWDGAGAAALLHDPKARRMLIDTIGQSLVQTKAAGVVFDFESLPAGSLNDYRTLLREARTAWAPLGKLVTATVPVGDADWNLKAFAGATDRLFLMDYDQHWQGGEPGPIAAQGWFLRQLRDALTQVDRDKLVLAVGSYAYDWHGGRADALSLEEAWLAAHDSGATIAFDPASGNSHFAYQDDAGQRHDVWMLDAASVWNELLAARASGVGAVALWRLGSEDPGVWKDFATWRKGTRPDLSTFRSVGNVDVEGDGEILRITNTPTLGTRRITFKPNGLIVGEQYQTLPTPYVVRRTGAIPKLVALTFDDGPDPTWTPQILDVLKREQAPGTFFVIGENALAHPLLLNRLVAEGHEIGNHSYTHPNLAEVSARGTALELNATQRLIEAYTGHATRLFRAPYFGDAEPTTPDELDPALLAQERGYTVVGLHDDPDDWKRPGVDAIVQRAIDQAMNPGPDRGTANVILLHDGGGDRAQTVEALPRIIEGLRARGFTFVPVSRLMGLSHAQVMPPVSGSDLAAVRLDVGIFALLGGFVWLLKWLFFVAILLGIARAVLMAGLAVHNARRTAGIEPPAFTPDRLVSVIIPAWNEEAVIVPSVARVLASEGATIEVIVADDGSKDRTSALVAAAFGDDPRVRLLTLTNGGKASALNRALLQAKGEIIVALDADTQFEPDTIARLVRWFADPAIGAVAGNAKVGNRVNLATRWQAVEYVTAQNVERRALAQFDAMTVVPGAVGAWRRQAIDQVGGYPEDTLAEDQDLTIAIQRAGWRIAYDVDAVAWTEAPESFKALAKQRFRWAFGTLQCLWKHAAILKQRQPKGLALIGLPQAWLFQIVFAAISPVIDLALLISVVSTIVRVQQHGWAQTQSDVLQMGVYWLAFTTIDILCGWIAYRLEPRERHYPAHLLVAQRFVYRQLMYWVVLKAIGSAVGGFGIGWGKLERTGRVEGVTG